MLPINNWKSNFKKIISNSIRKKKKHLGTNLRGDVNQLHVETRNS